MNIQRVVHEQEYLAFLDTVKIEIRKTRLHLARTANHERIKLYWLLGKAITEKQEQLGWGKSVVEKLSRDLRKSFEGHSGFSVQNLWYMRQFYLEYYKEVDLQQLVGDLPWSQNLAIMAKVKNRDARQYYLKATQEMGWSRNVLVHQIESQAYERHHLAQKQHNFQEALPEHLAQQAEQAMQDVYMLDMFPQNKS